MESAAFRREMFNRIKNATTLAEAQELALRLWHQMNSTEEGFICRGCGNCLTVEVVCDQPPPPPSPGH